MTTVRIEVDRFSPASEPAEVPEPAAEWGDLEFDNDPEMETIDGSIESLPDAVRRSNSRRPFDS
jgi:hypothetical protein